MENYLTTCLIFPFSTFRSFDLMLIHNVCQVTWQDDRSQLCLLKGSGKTGTGVFKEIMGS